MATMTVETYKDGNLIDSRQAEVDPEQANRNLLYEQAGQAIDRMTQIANATNPTNAQVVVAVKDEARAVRGLLRLALQRFERAE